jgi:hypothetical protein
VYIEIVSSVVLFNILYDSYLRQVPDKIVPVDEVHTADGHTRTIITINDQFPGPAIEVMEGAQVRPLVY